MLKDPEKREAYDQLGKPRAGQEFSPPPGWQGNADAGSASYDDVDLADLFAAFGRSSRGGKASGRTAVRGQDFEVSASVSLEQAYHGSEIEVRAQIPEYDANGLPHRVSRTFRITVPAGAVDGQRLRLGGKGGPGTHGGPPGDLYVVLAFMPHRLYRISGRDLYMDLPLAPWEAVLGAVIRVPTLDGPVDLNVRPGASAGQQLRLAKRGLRTSDGGHGALHAVIVITLPPSVSEDERVLYRQLAEASNFDPRPQFAQEEVA